jgi:hypothetical protein
MRFGEFLIAEGRVSGDQIGLSLAEQKRRQIPIGLLAMHSGLLNSSEVHRVLRAQSHRRAWRRFGDVAQEMGLLSAVEVKTLLSRQHRTRPRIGQILVEQGAISPRQLGPLVGRHRSLAHLDEMSSSWDRAV